MHKDKKAEPIPAKYRNPVIHDRGPSSYPGEYQVTDAALKTYGTSRELFGTTEVMNADGSSFRVKDCQYVLDCGSVGMTFLPVNDTGAAAGPDGEMVYSSVLVDQLLRDRMGLKPEDPIYALMYYIHPELNKGSVLEFAASDKVELGITHMGAYFGGGRTTNSPPLYHNRLWGVKGEVYNDFGYPANVMILSLDGVDQALLNKNLQLTDNVLNYGVRFPPDYKSSKFRPANINTALMFYRDWVTEQHYLRSDVSWFTYCAAHKTLVANVGLNLPHNLNAFKEIYGEQEGADFFKVFSQFHFEVFGEEFTEAHQTDFEPLWKKQGLTPAQIKPFTLEQYTAWDNALMSGTLDSFTGLKALAPDMGTPWAPQMTADVIYDFVQLYADFVDAGAIAMSATVFGFAAPAIQRTGISKIEYLFGAMPIVQHAMEAHARIYAAAKPAKSYECSDYYKATSTELYLALGGKDKEFDAAAKPQHAALQHHGLMDIIKSLIGDLVPEVLTWLSLMRVRDNWESIMAGGQVPMDTAYTQFMEAVQGEFQKARDMVVSDPEGVQFYTPPAIGHMMAIGMYPHNSLVSLKSVVTVMNYTELEKKT
ncbi:MAG: hypothetical protein H6985_12985 [Pseudomonadales bacterium]|nr:hypothetical protein [Pseudomonadales bacterium]